MIILVVDAQGGGMGKQIISSLRKNIDNITIWAAGTNSAATAAMLKAGADEAATGENAIVVCSRKADIIIGPIGMVIADSLMGEITAVMAAAIGRSDAKRIMLPVGMCNNIVAGCPDYSMSRLVECAVDEVGRILSGNCR